LGLAPGAKAEISVFSGMAPGVIVKKIPIPPTLIFIRFYQNFIIIRAYNN